ncbi:MAG: RagB/SusD family nutrient uptake outer membrane protein [Filimonas sp.]|nr:RagB/SusD family nutrient uptake outer membrane protein [Filimonas sp.]
MKRAIYYITIAAGFLLTASCSKTLEKEPLELINDDLVFDKIDKNADYAKQYLNGIYLCMPDGYNRVNNAFLDAGTDDAVQSQDGSDIESYRNGRIAALNTVEGGTMWTRCYAGIRRANMFLSKIDVTPADSTLKVQWKAEARFLRAYFYFELVKRWGGVPLLGDKVYGLTDNINLGRNSITDCINYILTEITAIQDKLVPANVADKDWARANKGAALALRSRLLLYVASPLYNTTNDVQKWAAAASAAKDVMLLGNYSLNSDFIGLFNAVKNTEIIFLFEKAQSQNVETNNGPIGYTVGKGYTSPSQNLVDAFLMKNGKRIQDAGSGYDATNPYANRDPRFDASILYNGKTWLGRPLETFDGGKDRPGGSALQTKTGYYLRKFMGKFESSGSYSNQNHHVILFRYAEILLNYAEALNEANGPGATSGDVYNALKDIRKRAGITAGTDNLYGLPATTTKDDMREIIRNERRIELAFEEQRFWDIRRWKTAESVMNAPVKGMRIAKSPTGTYTYTVQDVAPSTFDKTKMYWYPIPYSEIETNINMTQNPGWSY